MPEMVEKMPVIVNLVVESCDECNNELDRVGGPHGH